MPFSQLAERSRLMADVVSFIRNSGEDKTMHSRSAFHLDCTPVIPECGFECAKCIQEMETIKITPIHKHVPRPEFARSKKCGSLRFFALLAALRTPLQDPNGTYPQPLTGQQWSDVEAMEMGVESRALRIAAMYS